MSLPMVAPMTSARSNTGCWTCRIRKKKCDDNKPVCVPCSERRITCHGYGSKPSWMDCGEHQKAEVERIKRAVSQNYKSRIASRLSRKLTARSSTQSKAVKLDNVEPTAHSTESADGTLVGIGTLRVDNSLTYKNRVELPLAVPSTSKKLKAPNVEHPSFHRVVSQQDFKVDSLQNSSLPFSFLPDVLPAANEPEFKMIILYLESLFPLQYYFYQPLTSEWGRDWLLNLLLRAKSSYYVAIVFSVVYRLLWVFYGDVTMELLLFEELDYYHSMAISELQAQLSTLSDLSGPEHLRLGVEILACSIQLMSIEVFRGTPQFKGPSGDWEVHLQAAGALLAVVGSKLHSNDGESPDLGKLTILGTVDKALLPLNEIAGLDFFLTSYIWSDICRCASLGLRPGTQESFPYRTYLQEDRVHLDQMMGCMNWAMLAIRDISSLEVWKIQTQVARSLSLPDLAQRAADIEQRLNAGLELVLEGFEDLTKFEQECRLVTQVYGLSALAYLSIVVSGSSQFLKSELRQSVPKALMAMKALPPHLLIRVSWPFCVTGCMAHGLEMDEFKQLLQASERVGYNPGTLSNGLEIMEEFWLIREDRDHITSGSPWVVAMKNLGLKILLI